MAASKAAKQAVRMYLLLGVKDTTKWSLKQRYPNVSFVLENASLTAATSTYGQDQFKKIEPEVYDKFRKKLIELNDGQPTVPNDLNDSSRLGRFYSRVAGFTDVVASVYPPGEIWSGGEHPPALDREGLQDALA